MLKILAIAALSAASVTAYRHDFLDCATHAPLIAAFKSSKDYSHLDSAKIEARAALQASYQTAVDANKAKIDADAAAFQAQFKEGSDKCVAAMQACVAEDNEDAEITAAFEYGIWTNTADLTGWSAQTEEGGYENQFTPKSSADFDGWRECAAKSADIQTACCDSMCPMNQRDMVAVTRERFAKEMKAVKEVLATKAADGTYTYECEAGLTFEKLQPTSVNGYYTNFGSSDYDTALNVYKYINDGSGCTIHSSCGGKSCEGYSKEIPFDESKAYAIFLKEATYDAYGGNPTTEAELINPDCKIQMGCDVPAYDRCARDHYYSCKLKDGETWNPGQNDRTKIQSDCATKAACIAETVKCDKLKMPAKTDSGGGNTPTATAAQIAAAAKCTADNCATQAAECAADKGVCAEALKAIKAPPAGTPLATCIAGDAFTKCLAGTAGGKNVTQIITTLQNPKCELKNACEAGSTTTGSLRKKSACCLEAEEIAADAVCLPKFCADQEKACKADTANVTGFWNDSSAPTCGAAFFQGQTAPINIYSGAGKYDENTYDAGFKFKGKSGLTPAGQDMWECIAAKPYADCMKDELVKLCYGYEPGFHLMSYPSACAESGAATQFGSVVSLVAAVAAAMFN